MPVESFGIFQKTGFPQRSKIRLAFFCGIRYNKMNQYVCMMQALKKNLRAAPHKARLTALHTVFVQDCPNKREDY